MSYIEICIYYLLAINIIAFIVYGIDKLMAKKQWRRVSEFNLLLLAVLGGSIGAGLGMKIWRHKTQHMKFRIGVPLIFILQLAVAIYFFAQGDSESAF